MTSLDLLRTARDLESLGRFAEADRLRWAAACAAGASVSESEDVLGPAVREAEAAGDLVTVGRLLGALAGLRNPSRRAA